MTANERIPKTRLQQEEGVSVFLTRRTRLISFASNGAGMASVIARETTRRSNVSLPQSIREAAVEFTAFIHYSYG